MTPRVKSLIAAFIVVSLIFGFKKYQSYKEQEHILIVKDSVKREIQNNVQKNVLFLPGDFEIDESKIKVDYTFNKELVKYVKKLLVRYKSDFSSVVVIENKTGNVLAAVGHDRKSGEAGLRLPFSNGHPSASLIKIITSAELLEDEKLKPSSELSYRGRGTTLYKYQLKDKVDRWTRKISFKKAFALSNNVIFGKAAIKHTDPMSLYNKAEDFGFNKQLFKYLEMSKSHFHMPEDSYNLAEIGSGFNKLTLITPVHAALLSSIVANNGEMVSPKLVKEIKDATGKNYYESKKTMSRVIESQTSDHLKKMMMLTVQKGTARGAFRRMKRSIKSKLDIGGKTGSITGGMPYGKRDWFTAFAIPKMQEGGISIAVMNINVKKWRVRSSYLARKIIEFYYSEILNIKSVANRNEKKLPEKV